ncbi:hypothetical protein BOTBODRAFT_99567 [Botryobasidium botryosum FD-172 SS1]|uniref:NAD(P)-binding protein n=1 Tax=Botryobasidium botryosum (strain FD-172 SS1) TaxID=930990 RepID=A0A067N2P6_BOTB1|nr:hypothetical protein BOTBODRAFT_99567 [Botryobasidium botryosum FD-172 SS1]
MPSYLITGASKGLGLEFTKQLLANPANFVLATARNPSGSAELQKLIASTPKDRLVTFALDIGSEDKIKAGAVEAAKYLPNGLDYLINNAGGSIKEEHYIQNVDYEIWQKEIWLNGLAPLATVRAFLPLLRQGKEKKVLFLSSALASIATGDKLPGLVAPYAVTKTTLNMGVRKYGAELQPEGIILRLVHPGWVITDLGKGLEDWVAKNVNWKPTPADVGVAGALKQLHEATIQDTTKFTDYKGDVLAW